MSTEETPDARALLAEWRQSHRDDPRHVCGQKVMVDGRCDLCRRTDAALAAPPAVPDAREWMKTPPHLFDALGQWSVPCLHCHGVTFSGELSCRVCAGYRRIAVEGPEKPAKNPYQWDERADGFCQWCRDGVKLVVLDQKWTGAICRDCCAIIAALPIDASAEQS